MLLAKKYHHDMDVDGWLVSEKLDGCRARWDGQSLWTRSGRPIKPPPDHFRGLPSVELDGELYGGPGSLDRVSAAVRRHRRPRRSEWGGVRFHVFDAPDLGIDRFGWPEKGVAPYSERLASLPELCRGAKNVSVVPHTRLSQADLVAELGSVISAGGEGLMLRDPAAAHVNGRHGSLLKLKRRQVACVRVAGHEYADEGSGIAGLVSSIIVRGSGPGAEFRVASGLTGSTRRDPPPIGRAVLVAYHQLLPSGVPRFPVYIGPVATGGSVEKIGFSGV